MPWLRNKVVGRVWISDLALEFNANDHLWIDADLYYKSNDLQEKVKLGILEITSKNKGKSLKQEKERKTRKPALPKQSQFFPFGIANLPNQKAIEEIRSQKIINALKKIIPADLTIEIKYTGQITEKKLDEILNEQCKSLELIENLFQSGINIFVNGENIRTTKIPNISTTYMPNIDLRAVKSNIKVDEKIHQTTEAETQLKKLKKNQIDQKENSDDQREKSRPKNTSN